MIPTIYILIFIAWIILIMGFWMKEYTITTIAGFFLMCLGVYMISYGLEGTIDWLVRSFGIIHCCIGGYIVIRGGYEMYKGM